ncbi:MAG: hypothetical protein ACD_75C00840G0001 [uncultured bacterium]|nr:MAG: hypothetical protein ACD_75C00840G0001 [uncultured bacterium]
MNIGGDHAVADAFQGHPLLLFFLLAVPTQAVQHMAEDTDQNPVADKEQNLQDIMAMGNR